MCSFRLSSSTACHPFSSKACYVRFHLPPNLNPSFLSIPFELWSYNLSFLLKGIHSFFASHSNMKMQFELPPKLHPYFLCILFKLLTYNYKLPPKLHPSFLCIPIDLFFASHANYGQTISASSLNCSCPFFAYPLKLCAWAFLPDWIHSLLVPRAQIVNPGIKPTCRW